MATGRDLIYASLREIGAFGSEDSPSAEGTNDALAILNRMWGSWIADLGIVYAETLDSLALVPGTASYTIGATGAFVTARPLQLMSAQLRYANNIDVDISIITYEAYESISNKASPADVITYVAYNPTFPNGTLFFWPTPTAAYSVRLVSKKILADFDLDTTITLPPGYEDALVYNLAVRLSNQWGKAVNPLMMTIASESKGVILRANTVVEEMECDPKTPGLSRGRRFSWRLG